MATAVPAFRGSFGTTEFYVLTMQAGEFVRSMTIPKELEEWEDLSPEEKFQREINYKRVATHIAPYLAHDDDRFIGAFIVEVRQHDEMEFESLIDSGIKFPKGLPNSTMNKFGVLYLSGSEIMVPLDGQHRLAALEFAITGKDEKKADIKGLSPNPKVAQDTCTVILIKHDLEKARKIFNKVNKYAKPTSKADNLITDDSNYIAVLTREEVVGDILPTRLVNSSNTLTKSSPFFTTLATVYEINLKIEDTYTGKKPDLTKIPRPEDMDLAKENLRDFWKEFVKIDAYSHSLMDPSENGDKRRADIRLNSLACKPIVQRVLAETILEFQSIQDNPASQTALSVKEVVAKINSVDWSPENSVWQGILLNGDKVITGTAALNFAQRVMVYLLGKHHEQTELAKLREQFSVNTDGKPLPEPFF